MKLSYYYKDPDAVCGALEKELHIEGVGTFVPKPPRTPQSLQELAMELTNAVINVEPDLGLTDDGWNEAFSIVESKLVEFCQLQGWVKQTDKLNQPTENLHG